MRIGQFKDPTGSSYMSDIEELYRAKMKSWRMSPLTASPSPPRGEGSRVGVVVGLFATVQFDTRSRTMATDTLIAGRLYIRGEWSAPRADFASTNPALLSQTVGQ